MLNLKGFIVFAEVFSHSSNNFLNLKSTLCCFITIIKIVSLPKDADAVWKTQREREENFLNGSIQYVFNSKQHKEKIFLTRFNFSRKWYMFCALDKCRNGNINIIIV